MYMSADGLFLTLYNKNLTWIPSVKSSSHGYVRYNTNELSEENTNVVCFFVRSLKLSNVLLSVKPHHT